MNRFKVGARVENDFLGKGIVVDYPIKKSASALKHLSMTYVLFDKAPSLKYNCGENPTVMFNKDLRIVKDE